MPEMSAHTDLAPATGSAVPGQAGGPPDLGRMLVVVPAYNEAGRVGRVIADLHAALPTADVLVVNDGSADATAAEAVAAGAHVITLPVNLGYGAALQTGYKYAVRHHYDVVGQIDADGQHRPEHFPLLLERLTRPEVDVVLGSRFLDRDGHYRPSVARKLGIGLFGRLATAMTRQRVRPDVGLPGDAARRRALLLHRRLPGGLSRCGHPDPAAPLGLPGQRGAGADGGLARGQVDAPRAQELLLRLQDDALDPGDRAAPALGAAGLMPIETRILAVAGSLFVLGLIVELVRRRQLKEEYSLLWILTALVLLVFALWYELLLKVTDLIGAVLPSSTLFFFGLVFVLLMLLHFSVRVSMLERRITALVQEIGLLTISSPSSPHEPHAEDEAPPRRSTGDAA
jgi:hypothetical protein